MSTFNEFEDGDSKGENVTIVDGSDGSKQASVDSNGNIFVNLRTSAGDEAGTSADPIYVNSNGDVFSPLPALKLSKVTALATGISASASQTLTFRTAIKEFHLGGRAQCEGFLAKYVAATTLQIPSGGFNSSGQVSAWTNTGIGDSAAPTWSYATDQFVEGTGSAKFTFTKSGAADYPELTYTYSSPLDMSIYKTMYARVRVTVAAGGSTSRTVQVRLTSGTAIRIYSITGTTTTAPFSTEQWHTISIDLDAPSSTGGTGTFDINNVNSVSLRLQDGANKTGSIWWDDIKLVGHFDIIDKIYTSGQTTQLRFDPVVVFEIGEVAYIYIINTSGSTGEFQISTSGVDIT